MADDGYHKKLGEMQKYVPFLETTIKRLKSEKDKPREAQISKLQSLLVILTDSKKKLKLDALKKCEEVILKLYDKVEKKPQVAMHKYRCRTPPEETISADKPKGFDPTFLVARQKLKQTDTTQTPAPTPASPSPPLEQINICKPVVIPTEPQNPQFVSNWETNIPQTLKWPEYQGWQHNMWDTSKNYPKHNLNRDISDYSGVLTVEKTPNIKIVGNNKEIIPIDVNLVKNDEKQKKINENSTKMPEKPKIVSRKDLPLPPAPQSRKSLEKEILPFNKPPLTDRDLQDLLSPVTESSSGGHSPIFNEDMDLDKLEEIKAKLCKELEDEKPKHKKKIKTKSPPPVPPLIPPPVPPPPLISKKPPKIIIKEPSNVFGSLLSSIDDQIIEKSKKERKLNVKDVASLNDKVKSVYLKPDDRKPPDEFKKPVCNEKPKEADEKVSKTVEDIMKNLKESISKPVGDPLSKFGDLVKEKSDQLTPNEVSVSSGRLSDKYPHKRKSVDSRASDSPLSDSNVPKIPTEPVKLTDPRLRPTKIPSVVSPPLIEHYNHRNYKQNAEFSFQNSYNNMTPAAPNHQNFNIFCNEPPRPEPTPNEPFLNPVEPFLGSGEYFNQFAPNPPHNFPNQFNPNQNPPPIPPLSNPNWRFNHPDQYDLSQMNPIDFYDNNRFEPEFVPHNFRGRGNCNNRGNFGRGRGGPPFRDPRQDPRQFRNKAPLLPIPPKLPVPNKFPLHDEPPHKEGRGRFDDIRDYRGDRDYRKSRFSKEENDRFSRISKREEVGRKPAFVRDDPRRKSIDEPKETDKPIDKSDKPIDKPKEELQSPLDSLYSAETKRIGKGYGLQSFKIPKIKKNEETKDDTTKKEEPGESAETPKPPENAKTPETPKPPENPDETKIEAGPSKPTEEIKETPKTPETQKTPKTEADLKLDMFNNFMKHIFETCDSSVLFQYLDRCGFALPNAKTKRIRRIIDSDSSDTEDEQKKDEEPAEPEPEPAPELPEKIVETMGERIKNRRRKPVVYSSDSSPDKSEKKPENPDKPENPEPENPEQKPENPDEPVKQTVKTQAKTRRKNALELLQQDIREMFISEGVLTATGKRMCRMMKEHQESGFIAETLKQTPESEEEVPLVKRKLKTAKGEKSPEVATKRPVRKSPRVILEKIEIVKNEDSDSETEETPEKPETKKTDVAVRRTRRSTTISGEFLELDENGVVVKVQEKKTKTKQVDDDASTKSETLEEVKPVVKKRKVRRRGRGGWATGVIKNKKKKLKNPDSPAPTISAESPQESDDESPKQPFDEEYSLLKVDVNEDVNYFLDNGNKFNCKLCEYKGKLIVHHYRSKHPEAENMISRLSPEQASAAKIESNEFNFEEIVPYDEATKGKKRRTTFICRFCLLTFKQEFTCSFFDHICCHTGEYRYKCEMCTFSTGVKKTLSTHCHSLHPEMEKPLVIKPIYEGPPNFRLVFGYLCSACNFTQLLKPNVEKHIRVSHPEQNISIIKISMSTKPIPLIDLKKPGDDKPLIEETELPEVPELPELPEVPKTPEVPEVTKAPEIPVNPESPKTLKLLKTPKLPKPKVETPTKEKEPNLTVFMVPEEISQQEKLIESERLKKMEEIQNHVVSRRPKLQFIDKLKNKLDSVESEIALLESMEAENAALEAETSTVIPETPNLEMNPPNLEIEAPNLKIVKPNLEIDTPNLEIQTPNLEINTPNLEIETIGDKPPENWISIASTCSLANVEYNEDEPETELHLETLNTLSQGSKKTGFMDTIQRLAAQLQNNKTSSLSDCEDNERLYYTPEVTPDKPNEPIESVKQNAGSIEIEYFGHKNMYSCLIPGCFYISNLKPCFRKHLQEEHKDFRVSCGLCDADYTEWDLCGLFLHMLNEHKVEPPAKQIQIKEEPVDQPEVSIKTEICTPEKEPEKEPEKQPGSIRLRRISGDILSSFSGENSIEYPTISIPEAGQIEQETGFLQISNVRTLTPEEENHLQVKEAPKPFKKIIPKTFILNMGDLASSGVTKIVNNAGSSINLKRAASKEATTYNFTLKPNNETSPTLVTKTITSENKPTKTIIFRNNPPFVPIIKSPQGFIAAKLKTYVAPTQNVIKTPDTRLNKSEFIVSIMTRYPKILDFYKCPCVECIFSTNDRAKFHEHFAAHNRTTSGKYCVYCASTMAPNELIEHLERTHGNCNYQCALCFYRACFDMYITVHQSFNHQLEIPKFHIVKTLNSGISDDVSLIPRADAILPYCCALNDTSCAPSDANCVNQSNNCKRAFYSMNEFRTHLKQFHKRNNVCSICKIEMSNAELLLGHYVTHNMALFQCRHCKFGSERPQFMLKHYTVEHYNKKPIVYKREYKTGENGTLDDILEVNLSNLIKPIKMAAEVVPETQNHIPAALESSQLLIDPATGELTPNEPEIDETEDEIGEYEDSGLTGCELYVCGTSDCAAKSPNSKEFKDHLYSCDVLASDSGWYTCFHCKKRFKYIGALIKHLNVHGPQKYTCSLCPAKAHLETLIIKHMKVQHKILLAKVVPVDKTNPDSDFVAVVFKPRGATKQKSKKDDELYEKELQDAIKHTRQQIELIENDKTKAKFDENSFGPEDVDKLPRPPIFAHDVRCKLCSYNTKVRSNMLKHLNAHIENKPVAETAPVNPVPCLEKNELMFDKMTNLAASSHSGGRMGPKHHDKTFVLNYPGFVPASKRYVCGSINCNYLTHGDAMLRHHLTALHIDEPHYKCPHCQTALAPEGLNLLAVDNIMFHLKMHDLHLYKCSECQFYHYQKHKTERHLSEQHGNTPKATLGIIRELDNSANIEQPTTTTTTSSTGSSPEKTPEEEQPWRCGFCDYKTVTRAGIQGHAASVHKIRSQFKCGSCEFRCSARNNYHTHFKNKHPTEKVSIVSVYYKITDDTASNLSNSSNVSTASTASSTLTPLNLNLAGPEVSFDTTPLWTKNKTGVKHIRGILLDDSPVAKRPKIIEKMAGAEGAHNLRFPATYGANRGASYVCPTCNTFETKNSKQFVIHLYKEINYFRYMCNFCAHKSTHMAEAQKHFKEAHATENVVNNKQICTVLRYFAKAEKWVEKCLQIQQTGIQKHEADAVKQELANSSTETVLLHPEEDLEKPLLVVQQRRSARVTTKSQPNQNPDEIEEELSPPVLEPEIPDDVKPLKKPPLKCEHCPFVAKASSNLQKHIRKHFETKPYKCSLCSYTGSQLAHLQSHFYFKHTTEPLQYTLDPLPEVPQCRPLKRKRATSECETNEPPTKQPLLLTTDEPIRNEEIQNEPITDEAVGNEPIKSENVVKLEPPAIQTTQMLPTTEIKVELGNSQFYVCYHCPRRSPTLQPIREHFFNAHEKTYKNLFKYKRLTIDKPKKTKYSCNYCEWTGHPDGLKSHHLQKHNDKEYDCFKHILIKCEVCTEVFNRLGGLKKHFNKSHPHQNLVYQIITKENNDEYIETIEIIEEILEVKSEEQAQEINCAYCVLSFADVAALRAHHELVHGHLAFDVVEPHELKKYMCPQCEHTSNSFAAMRDHLRNHNKPYKCGHCDLTASYPSVLKTHHIKEHRNIEPSVLIINEAQRRNEELRDNLMHLQNGGYVRMKDNLKRPANSDKNNDDGKVKTKRRRQMRPELSRNVARKSTATPPRVQNVAKKSTTPRAYVNPGFSYYGTRPLEFDEIKGIKTELPIMGKNVPLNIGSMSQILQLFPVVVLDDIGTANI